MRDALPPPLTNTPHGLRFDPVSGPVEVLCGPVLCRLQFWSEGEWAASGGRTARQFEPPPRRRMSRCRTCTLPQLDPSPSFR